ncbi:2Fe-2S iron-sulfur cluster-binding protein [Streptomyces sp. NPDC048106]|uniref:2Fe-2S iron-sulfur cluster-binding protein n=1 Tax=Streptomyces sp. NPDC048106 TaxID=3155750 RepID=UPI003451C70C
MTDDQHGEGTPEGGGRWNPLPQGDYDDGATAFVKLPEGGIDALLSGDSPLAAPGHGYVPPSIPQAPADDGTGGWPAPEGGAHWPDPNGGQGGGQWPDPDTGQGATQGSDRFTYDPAATQHWNFEEPAPSAAPGHDVTGQWSIPVAGGELPDESGEFTTSALVEQWGGTPPATLPGGAPAPWATNAGQPWGDQGEATQGAAPGPDAFGGGEGYGAEAYDPGTGGHAGDGDFDAGRAEDVRQQVGSARARRQARAQGAYEQDAQGGAYGQDTLGRDAYGQGGPVPGAYEPGTAGQAGAAPGAHDLAAHAPGAEAPGDQGAYGQGGYEQPGQADDAAVQDPHGAQEHAAHGLDDRIEGPLGQAARTGPTPSAHPQGGAVPGAHPHSPQDQVPGTRDTPGQAGHEQDPREQAAHPEPTHPEQAYPEQAHPESGHAQPDRPGTPYIPAPSSEPSYPSPGAHQQDGHPAHHTPPAGVPVGPDADVHGPATGPEAPVGGPAEHADPATGPEAATPAHGTPSPTGEPSAPAVPGQRSGVPAPGVPGQRSDTPAPAPAAPTTPAPAHDGDTPDTPSDASGHADAPDDAGSARPEEPEQAEAPAPLPPNDDHPLASYVLRVNGADRPVTDAWIGESLLYVLRERLGLAGAKDGCSQGECGACNVQVDGRLVASCLVPAVTAAGTEVRTVEGLAQDGRPSDVQRALARCGAVQCGFCVPGMAMTAHDLLEGNPAPTELETRQALCGNLCRCSGYRGVVQAVQEVVAEREAARAAEAEAGATDAADDTRVPHQAGPGSGGNPSVFEAPGVFDTPPPTPDGYGDTPGPYDQHYGQDGGQA